MKRPVTLLLAVAVLTALGACGDTGGGTSSGPSISAAPLTTSSSAPSSSSSTSTPSLVPTSTTAPVGAGLSPSSVVDLRGIGPVRVGMTLAEASAAAGVRIAALPSPSDTCGIAKPEGGPDGVSFLTTNGRIARVDVSAGMVRTRSGAGVGDTEVDVQARYSGRLEVSRHNYVPTGHYLTLVPNDAADAGFRLIFETDGSEVTRYRAGQQPEVSYIEGCS